MEQVWIFTPEISETEFKQEWQLSSTFCIIHIVRHVRTENQFDFETVNIALSDL